MYPGYGRGNCRCLFAAQQPGAAPHSARGRLCQKSILEQENKNLNEQITQLNKKTSTNSNKTNTTTSIKNTQNSTTTQNTSSTIVYVTRTGEKYHRAGCSYLKNSKIEINLTDAKSQGYTPCSRCY